MRVEDIPNFEKLSDLDKLELAEELIASLQHPEELPVPIAHRLELTRRWAAYETNPNLALKEEQFWTQVRAKKA